jgi:uncharacterized protein YjbJ (UPF0337 family)
MEATQARRLMSNMGALEDTTDKIIGTAKEAVAEVIGDARLQHEGKTQQRKGANRQNERSDSKPLENLDKLT